MIKRESQIILMVGIAIGAAILGDQFTPLIRDVIAQPAQPTDQTAIEVVNDWAVIQAGLQTVNIAQDRLSKNSLPALLNRVTELTNANAKLTAEVAELKKKTEPPHSEKPKTP